MKIEEMKDAYNAYSEEDNIRKELLEAILNRKNSLLYQQQFIDSFNKTNNELYLIINKTNDEEERRKQKMPEMRGGGICRRLFYAALRRVRFVRLGSKERITRVFRDGYGHAACGERPERGKRGGSGCS